MVCILVTWIVKASVVSVRRVSPDGFYSPSVFDAEAVHETLIDVTGHKTLKLRYKTMQEIQDEKRMYNQYTLSNNKVILESELCTQ